MLSWPSSIMHRRSMPMPMPPTSESLASGTRSFGRCVTKVRFINAGISKNKIIKTIPIRISAKQPMPPDFFDSGILNATLDEQCGQLITCPIMSDGNSMCPSQLGQAILIVTGCRIHLNKPSVTTDCFAIVHFPQSGQGISFPSNIRANSITLLQCSQ